MIGVLTHHWAKTDRVDEAKKLRRSPHWWCGRATRSMIKWRASPERAVAMKGAEALWSKPPESERFQVA